MTERQIERVKTKIKNIKAALAADKKRWGGYYDDSRRLRYTPLALYIQIGDYSGGLRYLNWFYKNFPDDIGYPDFLFEWTIILFQRGRLKEAEKKAFETFCGNTYLFDKYFNRKIIPLDKWEGSNLQKPEFAEKPFAYSASQDNLNDFTAWLKSFIESEKFLQQRNKFIDTQKHLQKEEDIQQRDNL